MKDVREIISLIESPSKEDVELVKKAYSFAMDAHKGLKRLSGGDYFTHLHETARLLAQFGMRGKTIAAGLLHDSIEDGVATKKEVLEEFGNETEGLFDFVVYLFSSHLCTLPYITN